MTKQQRFKYEMFVRVRDFGVAHAALFPEGSKGGQGFARVKAATAAIEDGLKNHVLGKVEARRIKAATRESLFEYLKTIAAAARRVTRVEPSVSPFRLPTHRSLAGELATARAFMEEAVSRQAEFEQFGLPATFLSDFKTLVDRLQQAADVRLSSKTVRRKALAGIDTALAEGLDAARDLDVIVAIATRLSDPTTFAAWTTARKIEGQGTGSAKSAVATPVAEPPVSPAPPAAPAPAATPVSELEKAS